jgi:hypothetical protein
MVQASTWDDTAFEEMLNAPGELVANFIYELSLEATAVAVAVVHVRPGTPASATTGLYARKPSNARPPAYTKLRTRPHLAWGTRTGRVYGGVNAPYNPATWLETPAEQYHRAYPFLTTGLWSLEGTF